GPRGAGLAVRVDGGEVVPEVRASGTVYGHLPPGWKRAVVRTTSKKGTRAFVIEPAAGADERIEQNGLFVVGGFKVVQKASSTAAAQALWRGLRGSKASAKAAG
ncbi:MAG: hypothetical protein J2P46_16230, partial [Zavarzinella sp.]|nr:hypothetical protein [Zavarzinella sp.]